MIRYVEQAEKEGATIVCGHGKEPLTLPEKNKNVKLFLYVQQVSTYVLTLQGYFMRPTVITNISDNSPAMTEEIFGTNTLHNYY